MFKQHTNLKLPKRLGQRLWRYIKFERLIELINDEFLYFPHISKMTDKWEGLLTKKTKEKFFLSEYVKYRNAESAKSFVETYEKNKDEFFINCWHMNTHESYLMWKVYGNRGCAIQTTFERLKTAFYETDQEITGGIVNYLDYERDEIQIGNAFWAVSHKDLPYADEKEFRLFYWKLAVQNQNLPVENIGLKVKVDIDILIENIYINPIKDIDLHELNKAIKSKNLTCNIKESLIKEV